MFIEILFRFIYLLERLQVLKMMIIVIICSLNSIPKSCLFHYQIKTLFLLIDIVRVFENFLRRRVFSIFVHFV